MLTSIPSSYDSGVCCTVCDTELTRETVTVPTLGHDWVGNECTRCGELYTPFTDVPSGAWYKEPIAWAVENGVTNGLSTTEFGSNAACNRAQVATFLYRAYN